MKIFIIGCGAVAQCTIPLIFKNTNIKPKDVKMIDPVDNRARIKEFLDHGMQYEIIAISPENYTQILKENVSPGDICIDLANKVDTINILSWCHENNVRYLNTCLNKWKHEKMVPMREMYESVLQLSSRWNNNGPTSILSHGANPGLVSSFTKQALVDMAAHALKSKKDLIARTALEKALAENNFQQLARLQNIQVIHVAEKDTQQIEYKKKPNQFLSTWSVIEFSEECKSKAEFAWGTHENSIPPQSEIKESDLVMQLKAMHLKVQSWLPNESFQGIVPPHDEVFMIADYLSIKDGPVYSYRPTILFAYQPAGFAQESLHEFEKRNFILPDEQHVIHKGIIDGSDTMGALLLSPQGGWWTGSSLSIHEANSLIAGHNATVMQVAAGALAALIFMIDHPRHGIFMPEALDHEKILKNAKSYLGDFISAPCPWNPAVDKMDLTFEHFIAK